MCWSSRSVNTSQTCLMCSLVQLCCLHADLRHLALSLTEMEMGVDIGISYFSHCCKKVSDCSSLRKVFGFGLIVQTTVQSVYHGGESWQLEAVLTFLLARKQRGNVCAQLLSTFYYSVWYSSSWNSSAQTGQVFLIFLHQQCNLDIKASQAFFSQVILDFIRLTRLTVTKQFSYSQLVCLPLELCIVVFLLCILHPWMRLYL